MKLPNKNSKLKEIFNIAHEAGPLEISGEYTVDTLTGLPSLKIFSHRKVFQAPKSKSGKVSGHNLLFKNLKWGHFYVKKTKDVLKINYDHPKNLFLTNRIRDHIRKINDHLYIGRFNYVLMGKPRFLGYFSLLKIIQKTSPKTTI